jgi:hypothetical protein
MMELYKKNISMEERVRLVKEKFELEFGLSPDVVFYEEGKITAFKIVSEGDKIVSLVAIENKGKIDCYRKIV